MVVVHTYVEYFQFVPGAQLVTGEYRAQPVSRHVHQLLVGGDLGEPIVDEVQHGVSQLRQLVALGDRVVQYGRVGVAPPHHVRHTLAHYLADTQLVGARQHLPREHDHQN